MSGLERGIDPTPSQPISAIFHFIRAETLELEIQKVVEKELSVPCSTTTWKGLAPSIVMECVGVNPSLTPTPSGKETPTPPLGYLTLPTCELKA